MDPKRSAMISVPGGVGGPKHKNGTLLPVFPVMYHCIKMCTYTPLRFFDGSISTIFRLSLYCYWLIAGRYPTFLEDYLEHGQQNELRRLREELTEKDKEIEYFETEKDKLIKDKTTLEDEKQDLLRSQITRGPSSREDGDGNPIRFQLLSPPGCFRLSKVVSARLRDDNPNIVDLNDQCRPTKLAEMFSELYDNEWTSAFTVLEGPVGDKSAITILLDIIMQAYGFCEETVAGPWNIVNAWFLDMKLPGAQPTSKWLKDSRKANIRNKVPEVANDFIKEILLKCQENKVVELLESEEVNRFITKGIELCLLMVTTDPPVVPLCPGRRASEQDSICQSVIETVADTSNDDKDRDTKDLIEHKTKSNKNKTERGAFNKDLFKEYTTRGQYVDYVVWPALFLYKDGPQLSKGIAQGSGEQYREPENVEWSWQRETV